MVPEMPRAATVLTTLRAAMVVAAAPKPVSPRREIVGSLNAMRLCPISQFWVCCMPARAWFGPAGGC